jgi:hypothetical protein
MIATEKEVSLNNNIIEEAFAELESQRNLVAKEKNLVRTTEDTPDFM